MVSSEEQNTIRANDNRQVTLAGQYILLYNPKVSNQEAVAKSKSRTGRWAQSTRQCPVLWTEVMSRRSHQWNRNKACELTSHEHKVWGLLWGWC